ncbi:unnamed protein product [Mycena citricolor]|uniref:Major facilitator superfamily (MFS) profile domain-containing protein n=1 Tax=Mycena citricolor TaxID=2018698 RepID=A0AAD2GWQ6_9AGAR|nr:unnamed protein product [Mycena citricolor]
MSNPLPTSATTSSTSTAANASGALHPVESHVSHDITIHDAPVTPDTKGIDDSVYDKIPPHRKAIITAVLALCGFLAPISSTTVLAAIPEVAGTYHTTGAIINLSNAVYLIFMGISPCFWAPLSQVYGRRWICLSSAILFFGCSLGTALSPNLVAFYIFRDIYRPTERATALGWFLSGTLIGPAIGPFIAGVIVTYRSWRVIFYLQTALGGLATILVLFFLPETIHSKRSAELRGLTGTEQAKKLLEWTNPMRVVKLYKYPNLIIAVRFYALISPTSLELRYQAAGASSLVWNMYSLLTPIRYVINPRFHLTTPIQSGLFYLAPGVGYITGTFMGGRWADSTVRKWIEIRGRRVPEDRLRSCVPFMGAVIPGCMLIYGWSIERDVGGIPLPVHPGLRAAVLFSQSEHILLRFWIDVMQNRSAEVVAGNYMTRYVFAAAGSAVVLPAVEKIGVGWFSTISAVFLVVTTVAVYFTAVYGESWRNRIDGVSAPGAAVEKDRKRSPTMGDIKSEVRV